MKKIHKYMPKSVQRTVILNVLLVSLITTLGYSTTALQELSET